MSAYSTRRANDDDDDDGGGSGGGDGYCYYGWARNCSG